MNDRFMIIDQGSSAMLAPRIDWTYGQILDQGGTSWWYALERLNICHFCCGTILQLGKILLRCAKFSQNALLRNFDVTWHTFEKFYTSRFDLDRSLPSCKVVHHRSVWDISEFTLSLSGKSRHVSSLPNPLSCVS